MTPSWTKWIILSLNDYTKTYFGSDIFWIQGTEKAKNLPADRYEIRFLGPDINQVTSDETVIRLTVNCQVSTVKDTDNLEKHLMRVGKAQVYLAKCIGVYKYGSDVILDTQDRFANLQLDSDIQATTFGVDSVSRVERTNVEAAYKIVVD